MKRTVLLFALLACVDSAPVMAQDAATARANALADRQAIEDATKRVDAIARDVQDLQTANQELRRLNETLRREVESLRDELAKAGKNDRLATKDEIRQLVEKMQEMETNRMAEKELILKELANMQKVVARPTKAANPSPQAPQLRIAEPESAPSQPEIKGSYHPVAKGEYLGKIIEAYNAEYKERGYKGKITLDAVLKANPGLKPEAMAVGAKVFIPQPEQ